MPGETAGHIYIEVTMDIILPALDERLECAASLVRDGASVADIGTDHAFLPISLLMSGRASDAIASDINEGPLDRAKENARKYGIDARITFCLADGLDDLPLEEKKTSDIIICGMGGELISEILSRSDYIRRGGVRVILQPMTRPQILRKYLADAGFAIVDEKLCKSSGRIYQCIAAEYDGEKREISDSAAYLGEINIARGTASPYFSEQLSIEYARVIKRVEGMKAGGIDSGAEERLAEDYKKIAKGNGIEL